MKSVVLTRTAQKDLDAIWEYLALEDLEVADRMLRAVEESFEQLAKQPGIGHLREDLAGPRYRFFLVFSYLIVYRATTSIEIIRILHAARDVRDLLSLEG